MEDVLFLLNNKANTIRLLTSIFKKPNVNGTLERTKSAPGEEKSAQNKIEEKKILGVRACAHARGKTDGLSCLLQMRPFAARFAQRRKMLRPAAVWGGKSGKMALKRLLGAAEVFGILFLGVVR